MSEEQQQAHTFSPDKVERAEYQKLMGVVGFDQAKVLAHIRLGWSDQARLEACDFLCPEGYKVVRLR